MILKASQRGGGNQLGLHLLKTEENEHVELHEIRGFVADDLMGAMQEAYALSRGTRCRQFLFSVSLNPPVGESVRSEVFETACDAIEKRLGLKGQPRMIVFHEKEGRRHARHHTGLLANETGVLTISTIEICDRLQIDTVASPPQCAVDSDRYPIVAASD